MFTYLAIPYSDPSRRTRARRMEMFWLAAAHLIRRGEHVVSPMTLEPALACAVDLPYDWEHWREYSLKMMSICDKLVILTLDGWEASSGVLGEYEAARERELDIEYLDPSDIVRIA